MELDDLKQAFQALDCRVARQGVLLLRQRTRDGLRERLRPVVWAHVGQIALGVVVAIAAGGFWFDHLRETQRLVAGLLVHTYAILMVVLGARVLARIHGLDLAAPVLGIQRQLALVYRSYVICGLVVGLPWFVLWIPFVMLLIGDVSRVWLIANVLLGLGGIALVLWLRRSHFVGPPRSGSFAEAQRSLDDLARFEAP